MPVGRRAAISVASSVRNGVRVAGIHGKSGEGSSSGDTPLSAKGPYASNLKHRKVIRFDGSDVIGFLQGLVTNDVTRFGDGPAGQTSTPSVNAPVTYHPPLYAAMLNSQGRFLYDLFLFKPSVEEEKLDRSGSGPGKSENPPVLLADVDAGVAEELLDYLKKHILRKKVEVNDISEELSVWQYYGGKLAEQPENFAEAEAGSIGWGGTTDDSALSSAQTNGEQRRWYKDPRLGILGLRGLFSKNHLRKDFTILSHLSSMDVLAFKISFPHTEDASSLEFVAPLVESGKEVDEEYYLLWRLEQGIAEGSVEIPKGEAMPLEYNFEGLNAISFDKGCYVGQELVARTHHRGVIRKRLMPLNFVQANGEEAQEAVTPGAEVLDKKTGKKVGKVTTVLGPRGLGLVRLESAREGSDQLHIENQGDILVKPVWPKWWPRQWGREEEGQAANTA